MKNSSIFLMTFMLTITQYQNSFSMEDIRPGDPQIVDNLQGEDQEFIQAQIRNSIETIKLLIQENRTIGLQELTWMGYNVGAITIACNELGNRTANIKKEIEIFHKGKEWREKERKLEEQRMQMLLNETKHDHAISEIKKHIEEAFISSQISPFFITQLLCMDYSEIDIKEAFIELGSYQLYEELTDPIHEMIAIRQTQYEEEESEEMQEDNDNSEEQNELHRKKEIEKLIIIINAMENPNAMVGLPILTRIQFQKPSDMNLTNLMELNFKKEDIIAACKIIGLNDIPENLKKELF